jgi:hypothetical protein
MVASEPDPFKIVFLFAVGFYLLSQLWVYRVWVLQQAVALLPKEGGDLSKDSSWMDDKKKRKKKTKGN